MATDRFLIIHSILFALALLMLSATFAEATETVQPAASVPAALELAPTTEGGDDSGEGLLISGEKFSSTQPVADEPLLVAAIRPAEEIKAAPAVPAPTAASADQPVSELVAEAPRPAARVSDAYVARPAPSAGEALTSALERAVRIDFKYDIALIIYEADDGAMGHLKAPYSFDHIAKKITFRLSIPAQLASTAKSRVSFDKASVGPFKVTSGAERQLVSMSGRDIPFTGDP